MLSKLSVRSTPGCDGADDPLSVLFLSSRLGAVSEVLFRPLGELKGTLVRERICYKHVSQPVEIRKLTE